MARERQQTHIIDDAAHLVRSLTHSQLFHSSSDTRYILYSSSLWLSQSPVVFLNLTSSRMNVDYSHLLGINGPQGRAQSPFQPTGNARACLCNLKLMDSSIGIFVSSTPKWGPNFCNMGLDHSRNM